MTPLHTCWQRFLPPKRSSPGRSRPSVRALIGTWAPSGTWTARRKCCATAREGRILTTLRHDDTYKGEAPSCAHRREDMAEVSPISPLIHLKGRAATLQDILITSELTRRRPRAPDYASE